MAGRLTILPDEQTRDALARLRAPTAVHAMRVHDMKPYGLILSTNGGHVLLSAGFRDLAPKYEIFDLQAEPFTEPAADWERETLVESWDRIRCLFRYEWQRSAPPHRLCDNRGRREQITGDALVSGVSMVGIALWNGEQNSAAVLIACNDERSAAVELIRDRPAVDRRLSECEIVDLADVTTWSPWGEA